MWVLDKLPPILCHYWLVRLLIVRVHPIVCVCISEALLLNLSHRYSILVYLVPPLRPTLMFHNWTLSIYGSIVGSFVFCSCCSRQACVIQEKKHQRKQELDLHEEWWSVVRLMNIIITKLCCFVAQEVPTAFVSFRTRWGAAVTAQSQQAPNPMTWVASWAPEPKDVDWRNLEICYSQLFFRNILATILAIVLTIFYVPVTAAVQALANLDSLEKFLPNFIVENVLEV